MEVKLARSCVPAARLKGTCSPSLLIAHRALGNAGGTAAIITGSAIPQTLVPAHARRFKATISFVLVAALIVGSLLPGRAAEFARLRPVMYPGAIGLALQAHCSRFLRYGREWQRPSHRRQSWDHCGCHPAPPSNLK